MSGNQNRGSKDKSQRGSESRSQDDMECKSDEPGLWSKIFSEFLGTWMLVFVVILNVGFLSPFGPVAIAFVLMLMIYALGPISGAHFNPAVTIAVFSVGGIRLSHALIYIGAQLVAGASAGVLGSLMTQKPFALRPAASYDIWQAGVSEYLFTFLLCFVVLNVAVSKATKGNQFFGIAIGFVILAGGYSAGGISGATFNPAVAIGVASQSVLLADFRSFLTAFMYIGFQIAGSGTAVLFYNLIRPQESGWSFMHELVPQCLAEFVGTFFLVFTIGLNILAASAAPALSIAGALTVVIYSLGDVSGANFNPAVTLAITCSCRRKMGIAKAALYVVSQTLGGIAAGFTCFYIASRRVIVVGAGIRVIGYGRVLTSEFIFTFVLCFVVLCVATVKNNNHVKDFFGLCIGGCIIVGGFSVGNVSGALLNPAVSIPLALVSLCKGVAMYNALLYMVVELAGGILAAGFFRVTHQVSEYGSSSKYDDVDGDQKMPLLTGEEI